MSSLTIMQNRGLIRELLVEAKPKLAEESYRLPEIFYRQVDKYFRATSPLVVNAYPRPEAGEGQHVSALDDKIGT